jgi:hypothetical protein
VIDGTSFTRCDITNRDWSPPPKPQSCEFDWGNSLGLGFRGRGRFLCVSDAVDRGRTLDYGKSIKRGRFRCRSRMSGMRCMKRTQRSRLRGEQAARPALLGRRGRLAAGLDRSAHQLAAGAVHGLDPAAWVDDADQA